jgi:L-threonylcarbamoyladenylate synthase
MEADARRLTAEGRKVGVLIFDEDAPRARQWPAEAAPLGPERDPETVGRRLFAALRDLDRRGVGMILARLPERSGLGLAIRDRLFRAAEGRVIKVPPAP